MDKPVLSIGQYTINEPIITRHLKKEISFNIAEPLSNLTIRDFPNEKGYFMLWELTVSNDGQGQRIIPIFISDDGILRPLAGKMIWDALLDDGNHLSVSPGNTLSEDLWQSLSQSAQEFAYDTFLSLK